MSRCTSPAHPAASWDHPELHPAVRNASVLVRTSDGSLQRQQVFLAPDETVQEEPTRRRFAYQRIPRKRSIPLGNNRGQVVFCVAFPAQTPSSTAIRTSQQHTNGGGHEHVVNIQQEQEQEEVRQDMVYYQEPPTEEEAVIVAIKETRKRYHCQRRGRMISVIFSRENPYHEVAAMRHVHGNGDNNDVHCIMKCLDAFETETNLYIVTPYVQGGSLYERIPWWDRHYCALPPNGYIVMGLPENEVKVIFNRLVNAVHTLHQSGGCHRDLKPDNTVLLDPQVGFGRMSLAHNGIPRQAAIMEMHPVLIDLAMSLKIPTSRHGNHKVITDGSGCGTPQFMAPEVWDTEHHHVDGFQVDVWCLGMTLFCLLTGRLLYETPNVDDVMYQHFVANRGLVNDVLNDAWLREGPRIRQRQVLRTERPTPEFYYLSDLLIRINVVQQLNGQVRDLLQGMLDENPNNRMTLRQVQGHAWLA